MIGVLNLSWWHYESKLDSKGQFEDIWKPRAADCDGGVSVRCRVVNVEPKNVKKFSMYFTTYNGAMERVSCRATGDCTCGFTNADYFHVTELPRICFVENLWYNRSIRWVAVDRIEIVYEDGTTETQYFKNPPTMNPRSY